jgi:hypothetical protein
MKNMRNYLIDKASSYLPTNALANPPGMMVTEPATWQGIGRNVLDFIIPQPEDTLMGVAKPWYHGTRGELKLKPGVLYLSPEKKETEYFAKSSSATGKPLSYEIDTKHGKTLNIDKKIFKWLDSDVDIDNEISKYADKMRNKGYRYFEYTHPGVEDDFRVKVSLFPDEDLEIMGYDLFK